MKVKRRTSIYKVGIIDYLKINFYLFILFLKRNKRRLKILLRFFKNILFAVFLLIIYLLIIYLIGNKVWQDYTLFNCLWESKELIFSSTIVAIFIPYYEYMKKRNKLLNQQFTDYSRLYLDATYIMRKLTEFIIGKSNSLYENLLWDNENNYDYCSRVLDANYKGKIIYSYTSVNDLIKHKKYLIDDLNIIIEGIRKKTYIGYEQINYCSNDFFEDITTQFDKIINLLDKNTTKNDLVYEIRKLNDLLYQTLADMRSPWRWDRKIDKKIDLIIAKRAKCLTDYDLVRYRLVDKN